MDDLTWRIAEALATKWTSPHSKRNPDWDWEKPDGPDNLYYFPASMESRFAQPPYEVKHHPTEGPSLSHPTILEIAQLVAEAVEPFIGGDDCEDCPPYGKE